MNDTLAFSLSRHTRCVGTSSYTYPWKFLLLPATASLELVRSKAQMICSLNFGELLTYYEVNNLSLLKEKVTDLVPYFCFLSAYTLVLLVGKKNNYLAYYYQQAYILCKIDGYGFRMNSSLTVLDEVNGNKVTWALGSILYEINSLPWGLQQKKIPIQWQYIVFASLAGFELPLVIVLFAEFIVTVYVRTDRRVDSRLRRDDRISLYISRSQSLVLKHSLFLRELFT